LLHPIVLVGEQQKAFFAEPNRDFGHLATKGAGARSAGARRQAHKEKGAIVA
jgi:hypothetical protein